MKIYKTDSTLNCGPCSFINLIGWKGNKAKENSLAELGRLKPFHVTLYSSFLIWAEKYGKEIEVYTASKKINEKTFDLIFLYENVPEKLKDRYKKLANENLDKINKKFKSKINILRNPIKKLDELISEGKKVAVLISDYYLSRGSNVPHWIVAYKKEKGKYHFMDSAKGQTVLSKEQLEKGFYLNEKNGFYPQLIAYHNGIKILAVGDFHGEFPKWIPGLIDKEKIDLVISNGDYYPFHERKLWFKHCYGNDNELWEVIGKEKYKKFVLRNKREGEMVLMKLNSLRVPVVSVVGNLDFVKNYGEDMDWKNNTGKEWGWNERIKSSFDEFVKKCKNIKRFDYKFVRIGNYILIGARGGTNRGRVKSKNYRKHREKLDKLFKRFAKENREGKVIFVSHNVPYNTRLDKASKNAHPRVAGKHIGSKLIRRVIDSYRPVLHIGGHMHEASGKQKIGKTLAVNPGAVHDGQAAVIEIKENGRVGVKFLNK